MDIWVDSSLSLLEIELLSTLPRKRFYYRDGGGEELIGSLLVIV